jgi:LuxR family maltose regulon positive regulatory protein
MPSACSKPANRRIAHISKPATCEAPRVWRRGLLGITSSFGGLAVAEGLLQRAGEWLAAADASPEHALVAVTKAHLTLLAHKDLRAARALVSSAIDAARASRCRDFEVLAQALEGLALVTEGSVSDGMSRLDAATAAALSGELNDLTAIATTCCYLINGCERVRDYDRAAQWCARVRDLAERFGSAPLLGICRTQYAGVLMSRGDWVAAETELQTAVEVLARTRPALVRAGTARLGELRRRQGRWEEAAELFHRVETTPLGQLGLAEMAFDQGDSASAADRVERYLRRFPPDDRTERASGLELLVRVRLALDELHLAETALDELESIAETIGTDPLRGSASLASGIVEFARGLFDIARRHLEDAIDFFERSGCPFEAGRARLELAVALGALGRPASHEARSAQNIFVRLGATRLAERADALARSLDQSGSTPAAGPHAPLTERELSVLRLISEGLGDKEIAARLFLSPHTVHRHVSNILVKLDQPSRSAAVARAAREGFL